jgi:signal transduction histidine kinase
LEIESAYLSGLLDKLNAGMILVDHDCRIVYWNHWVSQATKLELADVKGAPFDEIFAYDAQSTFLNKLSNAIETQATIPAGIDGIFQIFSFNTQTDSSDILNRAVTIIPQKLGDQDWGAVIKITNSGEFDLLEARATLSAQVEERTRELTRAKEEAERSDLAKTQVLANLSHEFRTPLNAIIGFSDLMQTRAFGPLGHDFYKDYAESIYASGTHLLHLIEQVLDVSRIESGAQSAEETNINVEQALRNCCTMLAMQADLEDISMSVDIPENAPMVIAEPTKFQQIFINLITNAIKYNRKGGAVRVCAESTSGEQFVVRIEDTGLGIDEDELPNILQKFGRGSSSYLGGQAGLGLGLTIVQSLAAESSAEFHLKSKINVGTTAEITFPSEKLIWPPDAH